MTKWLPDDFNSLTCTTDDGHLILTVERVGCRRWYWWAHNRATCFGYGQESTQTRAQTASLSFLHKHLGDFAHA